MSPKKKSKKLFKVASEFNVSTLSIVETLSDEGFDVAQRPSSKITPEMYEALDAVYGGDREKSVKHDQTRQRYESRRSKMFAGRNSSVSVEDTLEPIEDDFPLAPQEDAPESDTIEGLKPQDPVLEDEGPELEESTTADIEEEENLEEEQEVTEVDTDTELEAGEANEDEAEQEAVASEGEIEDQEANIENELDEDAADEVVEDRDEIIEKVADEEIEDINIEEVKDEDEEDEFKEEGVIRGRAGRLKGTKVVGKVNIDNSKPRARNKRKRRKDRNKKSKKTSKKSSKSKKKNKKSRRSDVEEGRVEQNLQETLREMQSSETVGSRRQKRRRQRRQEREEEEQLQAEMQELESGVIEATEFVTVSELAELMEVKTNEVITTCMNAGLMVSINQRLDASTIELVAEEFGFEVEFVDADQAIEELELEEDDPEDLRPRAPIITVMGHVDHGKTSLLDYIRHAKVVEGEAGGITQHVGAYEIETEDGRPITFLDTPGHEAFTAMRSRGAYATDIVILVVAADDSVMPQTIEAINHSQAAGVNIVVAINKMDKPGANPDKIKQQLAEHDVIVEEYGGENQVAEVSAKTGEGIDELLEKVLIEAELKELKANPDRRADGVILESRVDKGKGILANLLIQNGSLNIGDPFVAGSSFGRVRAMENEHGDRIKSAGPSQPVQLMGFDDIPQAGDKLVVTADEKTAKEVAGERQQIRREQDLRNTKHLTLDDLSRRMALGEVSELSVIIKADVAGSIEALSGALQKISTDEVSVNIIHTGAGAITESDVLLASASNAIIIGFQVRPTANARSVAKNEEIDIRLFSVIYDAVDEVRDAMEGLLSPEVTEQLVGNAEIREIFRVSSVGTIAGCYVTDGEIIRNNPVRIIRDGVVIYEGEIDSLKRFKEDVRDVQSGYECGLSIVNYNDLKVGDVIENYKLVEEARSLEDAKSFE